MNNDYENDYRPQKQGSNKLLLIIAILLAIIAVSCIVFVVHTLTASKDTAVVEEASSVEVAVEEVGSVAEETSVEEEIIEYPDLTPSLRSDFAIESDDTAEAEESALGEIVAKYVDFDACHAYNPDIYAWIVVPGTEVDHPVLQSEEDNYYLLTNPDGTSGYPGSTYSNASCNGKDFEDAITILYAHNMPDGSMFTSLTELESESRFNEVTTIYIYTETKRLTYEIVAAVDYNDDYIPYYYDVSTGTGVVQFWNSLRTVCNFDTDPSYIREGAEVTAEDKLLVLSTCIRRYGSIIEGGRYLVIGKLVESADYTE